MSRQDVRSLLRAAAATVGRRARSRLSPSQESIRYHDSHPNDSPAKQAPACCHSALAQHDSRHLGCCCSNAARRHSTNAACLCPQQQQQSGQQRRSPAGQPGRLPDGRPIGPDSTRPGPPSSRRPGAAGDPAGTRRSPTTPDNGVGAGRTVPQVPPGDASGRTGLTPATSGTARNRSTGTRSGVRTSTGRDQQRRQQVGQQRRRRSDSTRRKQTGRASQRAGRSTGRSNVQHSRPGR
jgi:hypothetical protein